MFRAVNTFMEDRVQIINLAQVEHVQINSISTIVKIYPANLPLSHDSFLASFLHPNSELQTIPIPAWDMRSSQRYLGQHTKYAHYLLNLI